MTFDLILDILLDALIDTLKLAPFLLLTYLFMELIEHKTGARQLYLMEKAGHFGPALGALLGVVPQCGFAGAASSLYAGRVITMGTLISIYLSTSDEMLPILISESAPLSLIFKILAIKFLIGLLCGFVIDFMRLKIHRAKMHENEIHCLCEKEHCHCEKGIFRSSLVHTLQISGFIFLISLLLGFLINLIGEEQISSFMTSLPVLSCFLTALVGLIPNCAASVLITKLYLSEMLTFGSMISGLLVSAGVGLLILFRINKKVKENFIILGILYLCGVVFGLLLDLIF